MCVYQVYLDWVVEDFVDSAEAVLHKMGEFYSLSYGEKGQRRAMMNAQNYMNLDDHDVRDGFGSAGEKIENREALRSALFQFYQYQVSLRELRNDSISEDNIQQTLQASHFRWHSVLGAYQLVFLDERYDVHRNNELHLGDNDWDGNFDTFSDAQLEWLGRLGSVMDRTQHKVLVVTARPFGFLSTRLAGQAAYFTDSSSARDNPQYPDSVHNTRTCLQKIFGWRIPAQSLLFIGGDVHQGFLSSIWFNHELKANQVVTSAITRESVGETWPHERMGQYFYSREYFDEEDDDGNVYAYRRDPDSWTWSNNFAVIDGNLNARVVASGGPVDLTGMWAVTFGILVGPVWLIGTLLSVLAWCVWLCVDLCRPNMYKRVSKQDEQKSTKAKSCHCRHPCQCVETMAGCMTGCVLSVLLAGVVAAFLASVPLLAPSS